MYKSFLIFVTTISLWMSLVSMVSMLDIDIPDPMSQISSATPQVTSKSIYDYTVKNLDGEYISLSSYMGYVLLIVNYASTCGFTMMNVNYLSNLAKLYADKNFKILMFPSNTFKQNNGGEAPGIMLRTNHPEFDVFSIIEVNGSSEDALYTYLKSVQPGPLNCIHLSAIPWNFSKFLVDRNGNVVKRFDTYDSLQSIDEAVKVLI